MSQSAKEISDAINRWIEDDGLSLPVDWSTEYRSEIRSWGDLIYYMEDEAPKAKNGLRWMDIPGVDGAIRLKLRTGGEGQGEESYAVFELTGVPDCPRYFRMTGYYVSHDGFHYENDNLTEVRPVEKPVVFWDAVQ